MSSVDQNKSLIPYYQIVLSKVHWSILEVYSFFLNEKISSSNFKQRLRKLKQISDPKFHFTYCKLDIRLG